MKCVILWRTIKWWGWCQGPVKLQPVNLPNALWEEPAPISRYLFPSQCLCFPYAPALRWCARRARSFQQSLPTPINSLSFFLRNIITKYFTMCWQIFHKHPLLRNNLRLVESALIEWWLQWPTWNRIPNGIRDVLDVFAKAHQPQPYLNETAQQENGKNGRKCLCLLIAIECSYNAGNNHHECGSHRRRWTWYL